MANDSDVLSRVLKELNDVATEAARLEQALDEARTTDLRRDPVRDRRTGQRRNITERRGADRRTSR